MSAAREDLTVYWGVASGSTHATFRRHYEGEPAYQNAPVPTHLMVNWMTENNQVWEGPTWMIDSGGAPQTIINNNGYPTSIDDYLDYLEDPPIKYNDDPAAVDVQQFALRDWPCEPDVRRELGLSVAELQHRTLVDHIEMMDKLDRRTIDAEPVAVLQGWAIEDYLAALDAYKDHGLITDKMAIGTLCGRTSTQLIRTTSWRIARNLPARCTLHGFGVKTSALNEPDAIKIFDSVDTLAWDQTLRQATKDGFTMGPPGGTYDDWIDWDNGNPRYTARNLWPAYRGYADQLRRLQPVETPSDMRVVTLDQLFQQVGETPPEGTRVDQYVVAQCACGSIIDPGRPDPLVEGGPQCRFCERSEVNILGRRIDLEDQLRLGPAAGRERPVPGSVESLARGGERPVPSRSFRDS